MASKTSFGTSRQNVSCQYCWPPEAEAGVFSCNHEGQLACSIIQQALQVTLLLGRQVWAKMQLQSLTRLHRLIWPSDSRKVSLHSRYLPSHNSLTMLCSEILQVPCRRTHVADELLASHVAPKRNGCPEIDPQTQQTLISRNCNMSSDGAALPRTLDRMAAMPLHVSACWRQCRKECMLAALPL